MSNVLVLSSVTVYWVLHMKGTEKEEKVRNTYREMQRRRTETVESIGIERLRIAIDADDNELSGGGVPIRMEWMEIDFLVVPFPSLVASAVIVLFLF